MSAQKKPPQGAAELSRQDFDANTVLPRSRYLVYAVMALVTWLLTMLSCIGTLPVPFNDWAAWQEAGADMQLVKAGFFAGMLLCVEYIIASTIYLRVAQRRTAGAIAQEVVGEVLEIVVEAATSSGSRKRRASDFCAGDCCRLRNQALLGGLRL
jgi:hypothetical protein